MVVYQVLSSLLVLSWITPRGIAEKRSYITYDMGSLCNSHHNFKISMHHSGAGSTGILKAGDYLAETLEKECIAVIKPPPGYGVVFDLEDVKLRRDPNYDCRDFIKIYNETSSSNKTAPTCRKCCRYSQEKPICKGHCGYEDDGLICQEYCGQENNTVHMGTGRSIAVLYHTRCGTCTARKEEIGFRMVFTAFRITSGTELCNWPSDFQCDNGRCIWSGLTCDGHNNCGDSSDESPSGKSQCGGFPHPIKAAIVASAVLATVLLGVVLAYLPRLSVRTFLCRRRKKKASIRLTQQRKKQKPNEISKERLPGIRENPLSETDA